MSRNRSGKHMSRAQAQAERKINSVMEDHLARQEGPAKKAWSFHDLQRMPSATSKQKAAMRHWADDVLMLSLLGTAGTAKTYTALRLACEDLVTPSKGIKHIKILRAPVQSAEQGHLPGTLEEKNQPFEGPYPDILAEIFGRPSTYKHMKSSGVLSFESISFLRGMTYRDTIVVLDEVQNCTFEQIHTVVTRLGKNSRLLVTGDTRQIDLSSRYNQVSGIAQFKRVCDHMAGMATATVDFGPEDIVRGDLVRAWILACEKLWAAATTQHHEENKPCTAQPC